MENKKEIPALITSFAYGPIAGAIVIVIRCLIKLPFTGTACVGELADLLIGLSLVIPAGIIYKRHKSLKGALAAFAISASIATVVALVANWLILIPFYIDFYFGGSINPLLGMMPSFLHVFLRFAFSTTPDEFDEQNDARAHLQLLEFGNEQARL